MVTVGNQGQDDRCMRLWRRNFSVTSRGEQIVRLSRFRPSVPIMADNREVRTIGSICVRRNIRQVKEKALYYSFSVLLITFCRQTSILRCVIMVDVFSHQGGCCMFTISTLLCGIQPCILGIRAPDFSPQYL